MTAAGLIFTNIHDGNLSELTSRRTMASVPFGCRYRLIDFALSNMVNSGISNIGIITRNNYRSLLDHIGSGTDWDLARRSGGIKTIAPFVTSYDGEGDNVKLAGSRLESLKGAVNFISRAKEEYIALSDCDVICNIDISDMLRYHAENNADITFAVKELDTGEHELTRRVRVVQSDENNKIVSIAPYLNQRGRIKVSTNVIVMKRTLLYALVLDAQNNCYTDFYHDIIVRNLGRLNILAYNYDGYYSLISNLSGYFNCNMKLLEKGAREELFGILSRPIYTKVKNSPPTKYCSGSRVENSLIADGCVIKGRVENSILFRGVTVGEGSVVKNCILLQDTSVGERVKLNSVIADKNAVIKDERTLSGHGSMCFFIDKGISV